MAINTSYTPFKTLPLSGKEFSKKIHEIPEDKNLKLYAVVLGGRALKCNTELHDVVFTVGSSIHEKINNIIDKWFGIEKGLHIDAFAQLKNVGGFKISLSTEKPKDQENHLYFLNYGGYSHNYFGEHHQNGFFVGKNLLDVKKQAVNYLCKDHEKQHLDDTIEIENNVNPEFEVDDAIELNEQDNYYIHLTKTDEKSEIEAFAGYGVITRDTDIEE